MIILILIILIIIYLLFKNYEYFNEVNEVNQYVDYYVIHMKNSCNKKRENINCQSRKLGKKINIFDAINGKYINNFDKYDKNIKLNFTFITKEELGCYLSHLMLIKKAINSNKKYTVIFEDDFKIISKDLDTKILDIVKKLNDNFDIVYLGNLYESKSEKIIDDIYKKNNIVPLCGTHAYLINNKSAQKIYNNLLNINQVIDRLLDELINENKLNGYVIYPSLVIQNNNFESTIRSPFDMLRRYIMQKVINIINRYVYN